MMVIMKTSSVWGKRASQFFNISHSQHNHFHSGSRSGAKPDSSSSKKTKSKAISKLSHDLFTSGSYEDQDSGDLFSPLETSKDLSTATPTVKTATPTVKTAAPATTNGTYVTSVMCDV